MKFGQAHFEVAKLILPSNIVTLKLYKQLSLSLKTRVA